MKVKLNKNAQKLVAIAPTGKSKPILQNIHIENGEASAADGFILAVTKVEAEVTLESPAKPMNIPTKLVNLLKGFTRSHHRREIPPKDIIVEVSDGSLTGTVENSGALTYTEKENRDNYPSLDNLWPNTPYKGIISLNAERLRRICSLAETPNIITFRIRGINDPVEFVTGEFHGLIMPMFAQEVSGGKEHVSPLWSKIEGKAK